MSRKPKDSLPKRVPSTTTALAGNGPEVGVTPANRIFSVRYNVVTSKNDDGVDQYDGRAIVIDLNTGDSVTINVHEDVEHNESFDAVSNVVTGMDGDGLLNKEQLDVYQSVRDAVQERCVDPGPFVITISDEGLVVVTRLAGQAVGA